MLIIERVFATLDNLAALLCICAGERTLTAVLVVELEGAMKLQIVVGVSPSAIRI